MRRLVIWLASTVTVVVLLFSYHTSTNSATHPSASGDTSTVPGSNRTAPRSPATGAAAPPDPSSESSTDSSGSSSSSSARKSYTGDVVDTRWGPVQVKITVESGTITAVDVVQHPSGNDRDAEINDYALPILVQATLKAQSASIDMVSGATVTSDGYVESLQSALDRAGL